MSEKDKAINSLGPGVAHQAAGDSEKGNQSQKAEPDRLDFLSRWMIRILLFLSLINVVIFGVAICGYTLYLLLTAVIGAVA